MLGVPPARLSDVFDVDRGRVFKTREEARRAGDTLARRGALLYDTRSKPDFGSLEDVLGIPEGGTPGIDPAHPEVIRTVRGVGYMFVPQSM